MYQHVKIKHPISENLIEMQQDEDNEQYPADLEFWLIFTAWSHDKRKVLLGKFRSGGVFNPLVDEGEPNADTVTDADWCSEKVRFTIAHFRKESHSVKLSNHQIHQAVNRGLNKLLKSSST